MQDEKLILLNRDGTQTVVEDPFRGMRSTYDALRADATAMPELNPESRARILQEIADGTAPAPADPDKTQPVVIEAEQKIEPDPKTFYVPNRHDRRRQAAIARRERKQKTRKH